MTTMPQYKTYTHPQLQCILRERQLRVTGTKAELIARLVDNDNPFPFLKLPGEIRNKIYKYILASERPLKDGKVKSGMVKSAVDRRELPRHICAGDIENQTSFAQPGFFQTCSQIYHESRAFFYHSREFKLHIWQDPGKKRQSRCLLKVLNWLDFIGGEMQAQIRILELDLQCDTSADLETYIWFIDNLHAKLSEKATVTYRPISQMRARHDVAFMWGIGKELHGRDVRRVPRFEHPNWSIRTKMTTQRNGGVGVWAWGRSPLAYTPKKANVDRPSLTFGPDQGWFGKKA